MRSGRLADHVFWPLLAVAGLAHGAGLALVVAEFRVLDLTQTGWFSLAAFAALAIASMAGFTVAVLTVLHAAMAGRGLRTIARWHARLAPPQLLAAAARLGLSGRVQYVHAAEPFALTHGLLQPRVLVSTAAVAALDPAELAAVLGHERAHLRRRDPLRLLAARMLAGHGCYLPAVRWLSNRFVLHCELTADRAALDQTSPAALAGALLKLAPTRACSAAAAATPPETLDARIAQLEHGRPRRPRLGPVAALATLGNGAMLAAAVACCLSITAAAGVAA